MTPIDYLYSLELHGIKLGLDNISRLLRESGDPQLAYPTVHVGGTNGKGSVVALLDAMLRAAGYTTGRFTSPHLCSIQERFQISGVPIDSAELDTQIDYYRSIAEGLSLTPTFFELNTAIAFRYFAERQVDIALIEVGLGGRFDSTNVLEPIATAVTNIALEHTQYLGETLEAIAFEKAGIAKSGSPLILGETRPGPRDVILEHAEKMGSPVKMMDRDFTFSLTGASDKQKFSYDGPSLSISNCPLGLPGAYQAKNAAVAVALAEQIQDNFPALNGAAIEQGLTHAKWPCRLEKVLDSPEVIIDVAHNAAGAEELASALDDQCALILAVSGDKDAGSIIESLAPLAKHLILTQFEGPRTLPVDELCELAGSHVHQRVSSLNEALSVGMALAKEEGIPLVIAGSLFGAGEARQILIDDYGAPELSF